MQVVRVPLVGFGGSRWWSDLVDGPVEGGEDDEGVEDLPEGSVLEEGGVDQVDDAEGEGQDGANAVGSPAAFPEGEGSGDAEADDEGVNGLPDGLGVFAEGRG